MQESYKFDIHSSLRPYTVRIGSGIARDLLDVATPLLVVDEALQGHFPWLARDKAVKLRADESEKTLETVTRVIESLRDQGADRQSRLLAIGGGIVQDVATASASLYMRGISWSYCPTTLLGMVDSCIGGKSSINVGRYKNIAGNFFPPQEVVIDTDFCGSLPVTQRVAGLCEAVKICFAQRGDAFQKYLGMAADIDGPRNAAVMTDIIALSLSTKKAFIEEDEFDQGVRLLLNFGHTFGHALEAASHFSISHGVAVGLGMLAARRFSIDMGWLSPDQPRALALEDHVLDLMRGLPDLQAQLAPVDPADALGRFRLDKKHRAGQFAVIAVDADGQLQRRLVPIEPVVEARLVAAFACLPTVLQG